MSYVPRKKRPPNMKGVVSLQKQRQKYISKLPQKNQTGGTQAPSGFAARPPHTAPKSMPKAMINTVNAYKQAQRAYMGRKKRS